jgi:hypothetical protein
MAEDPAWQKKNDGDDRSREDRGARLALIYNEAVRGLTHQQGVVESLNMRAGNLIFATAFVGSLLGVRALADGIGFWEWAALTLLLAIGGLVAFILWPYHNYVFRFEPRQLLAEFGDIHAPSDIDTMHRMLAERINDDLENNWRIILRLRLGLQLALVIFVLNIVTWLFAIAAAR